MTGGLDLAAEAAGIEIAAMCEIEPFCRAILAKRWPGVPVIEDVRTIRGEDYAGTIDIVFGGFPCQDLSVAGRQAGLSGERSGLWFEMFRIIEAARPRFVVAENVRGAVNLALDTVRMGLEEGGYRVWPFVVPASAFGAPHKRERLFVVGVREDVADGLRDRLQGRGEHEISLFERPQPADEQLKGCGRGDLWTTPTVNGNNNRAGLSDKSGNGLATAVRMWATPNTMDSLPPRSDEATQRLREGARKGRTMPSNLREQVDERTMSAWRTPSARDYRSGSQRKEGQQINLNDQTGGQLNPDWVSQMMGLPYWWTNPEREVLYATTSKTDAGKVLLVLRREDGAQEFQWEIGRYENISEEEILLMDLLREIKTERTPNKICYRKKTEKVSWSMLRKLRYDRKLTNAPYRHGQIQQFTEELDDFVSFLSYEMALETWKNYTEKTAGLVNLWCGVAEVGYIPESLIALHGTWRHLLSARDKYIAAAYAFGLETWPAVLGERLWMTPQATNCGMTCYTTGRPLEKSTHLQAQVYCAETRMWGTPSASDCQGSHGGGQGKSLRTDISDVKHGLVSDQYPYEFPRTVKGGKNRAARIKALGNAVVPQQAYPFFRAIAEMDAMIRDKEDIAS